MSIIANDELDAGLQALLAFLEGKHFPWARGITTFPTGFPAQHAVHEGCLALERRGYIVRQYETEAMVGWLPREECPHDRRHP